MKKLTVLSVVSLCMSLSVQAADWTSLFNGKDLSNWQQLGGKAKFTIDNGVIVGESKSGEPNSFLTTKQDYSDFIFETEIKIDAGLNSGIQFRSQSLTDYNNGRVHGYQMEIDTSDRKWSGGVFEEAKRGWLYAVTRNEACQNAFNLDVWNHYRVEAIHNRIRTWVNKVACADVLDNQEGYQSGFIAFQVHSIKNKNLEGTKVRFRNPRILTEDLHNNHWYTPSEVQEINYLPNQLSAKQQSEGWTLLWDGKTTNGWKGTKLKDFPQKGWDIDNGELVIYSSGGGSTRNGGDIVTLQEFSEFELEVDFKITAGANSGIKYFVDPNLLKEKGAAIGLEFQILDDKKHPDAKKGHKGNRTIGSLYDLIPARNLSELTRSTKRVNSIGDWNRARIVVKGNRVEHWLNNIKVVEYPRGSQIFKTLVQHSKYAKWPNFGQREKGPIILQDHGDEVRFRSIKVRSL
ncbi:3-keto-disaccharide hydrolase [Paraglaciecola sp.]|uniref:3-keto-disaccharide hydrolase n=1 Tax=Paraglaciecola sp. TaxID=1920173 RepID=UPI003EFA99F0